MDLPKAKSVIIIMLVAFNIFLLFNNWTSFEGQGIQKETIKNTAAILSARGVILDCSIPRTSKAAYRLGFGSGRLDRAAIAGRLLGESLSEDNEAASFGYDGKRIEFLSGTRFVFTDDKPEYKVDINEDDEVGMVAMKYLKDMGLLSGKYVQDELRRDPDGSVIVTFVQEYEGLLVYDNYCTVTVTGEGITKLEYGKLQITGFTPERVQDLAAAYQVLLANYKEGSKMVITSIDVGYKYSEDNFTEDVQSLELLPVWRVKIKDVPEPDYLSTMENG